MMVALTRTVALGKVKGVGSGCVINVNATEIPGGLDEGCEREKARMILRFQLG